MAHDPVAMGEVEDVAFEAFVRKARDAMPEPALQDQVGAPRDPHPPSTGAGWLTERPTDRAGAASPPLPARL